MSCLKILVVLVHHLGVQRQVHTFLILTLLLFLTVQFFGIADVLSMHLFNVPRAYAFQRSDCLMLLFLQELLRFPCLVLLFCSFFLFGLNLSSTPQPLASLVFDTHLLSLKPLAASHELRLIAVCFRLRFAHRHVLCSAMIPVNTLASC